jgi:hypothetical protein
MEIHRVEMLRLAHFIDSWFTNGGEVVTLTHHLPFIPRNSFLLEAESTPGP